MLVRTLGFFVIFNQYLRSALRFIWVSCPENRSARSIKLSRLKKCSSRLRSTKLRSTRLSQSQQEKRLRKKLQPQAMQLSSLRSPPQALSWPQTRPPRRGTLEKSPPPFPNGIRSPSQSRHTPRNLIWLTRYPIRSIGRKRRNSSVASTNNLEKSPAPFQLELSSSVRKDAPSPGFGASRHSTLRPS